MKELRQRFWLRLTTWVTVTACFAVLIGAGLVALNLTKLLTMWGDDIQITAYLSNDVDGSRVGEVERKLIAQPDAGRIEFVSREKALAQFREQLASYAPDLAGDDDLLSLIPPSFQISLSGQVAATKQAEAIRNLAGAIGTIDGVEDVRYGQEWIRKYASVVAAARGSFVLIGIVLLLAAFFVVGNAVRASVDARRDQIEVYELIGATPWMIRRPFLLEGAFIGIASALTALVMTAFLFSGFRDVVAREMQSSALAANLSYLPAVTWLPILLAASSLGAFSSYLCVRRINTGFAASGARE